jgi:signal transduction histidine kinase
MGTAKSIPTIGSSALAWRWFRNHVIKFNRVIFHPIFIFVVIQLVSIGISVLWVVWYVNQKNFRFGAHYDLTFLVTGCILIGIILIGTVLLFVFAIKQSMLNKQQRSFVSSVTHELRSPVASIQLSMETLEKQHLDTETKTKIFSMMRSDMDRLVNLVDQILVSARLDRGIKIFDEIESFYVRDLIARGIEGASHLDKTLPTRVQINCEENLSIIAARPAVALVIGNLIENAVKYSPAGSPISVNVQDFGDRILLNVKDRGFGLDGRERKNIFKIFHRGDIATKKAIPGTGLGLYIVKSVVKVLGGRVWAESAGKGTGSTFYVQLPKAGYLN